MAKAGHNSLDRETYLRHQAMAILDKEAEAALKKRKAHHRKDAELVGVPLAHMDWVIKMIGQPVGEIATFFRERLTLLSFNGVNIAAKIDGILGDHTEDQTFAGQLAGMMGKVCSPPANLTPHEKQTWIVGWHEGNKARDEATAETAAADARAAELAAAASPNPDSSTEARQELGDDGYGEGGEGESDGEGFEASADELAAQALRPSVQEQEEEPTASPHQPAKRRAKASA